MQVIGVLTWLLPLVKAQYPDTFTISIKSDNASCLASHDSIACIHHLNKDLEALDLVVAQLIYRGAGEQETTGHPLVCREHCVSIFMSKAE
jgi:hypothetical protein